MKLVFATNNSNKIKEVSNLISNQIEIINLKDIGCKENIIESENTIIDNAILKANYIKNNYGYDCFADDTGLEVDFLNGRPGVYSKRFAGENSTDELNMEKLLECMRKSNNRNARFRTVIALNINNQVITFTGLCEGKILKQRRGNNGFGYDPIFFYPELKKTFAELKKDEKNNVSHRGKALRNFCKILEKQINHKSNEI